MNDDEPLTDAELDECEAVFKLVRYGFKRFGPLPSFECLYAGERLLAELRRLRAQVTAIADRLAALTAGTAAERAEQLVDGKCLDGRLPIFQCVSVANTFYQGMGDVLNITRKAYKELIAAAIRATAAADVAPADKWQPIETAPKDGTQVLIGWVGSPLMYVSRWLKNEEGWVHPPTSAPLKTPTHWMPLPAAPIAV